MNINKLSCVQCHTIIKDEKGRGHIAPNPHSEILGLTENAYYTFTCPKGHVNHFIHDNLKFEILFELGVNALNDDYYREAITNFAASYERFHEYMIMLLLDCKNFDEFDRSLEALKLIEKQSERQYRAFVTLYYKNLMVLPPLIQKYNSKDFKPAQDIIHFRNNVVHQGYIPTKEQAITFAKATSKYIEDVLSSIHENDDWIISKTNAFYLAKKKSICPVQDIKIHAFSIFSFVKSNSMLLHPELSRKKSFEEHLQMMKKFKNSM